MNDETILNEDGELVPVEIQQASISKVSEVNDIIKSSNDLVKIVDLSISTICSTIEDIKTISAQAEVEMARMDHMIDALMIKANRDIEIYKVSIPTLNRQFELFQKRLDELMNRALDMVSSDFSENAMARSEFAMRLIEQTNGHLNNLIEKLIPRY